MMTGVFRLGAKGLAFLSGACSAIAEPIISVGDPVVAVDEDIASNSNYPGGESPDLAIDGSTATKYLNFGRENSGLIITPAGGSGIVRSFQISTANDSVERDPVGVVVYGTNLPIVSTDNSAGSGESWTRIAEVDLSLPDSRNTAGPVVNIPNDDGFSSYKFVFTAMKGPGHNSMQISELQGWNGMDGAGAAIFGPGDNVLAVHEASPESSFPAAEGPENLFDETTSTKYLNFGRENSGFIVTPTSGPSLAGSFIISTANDFEGRDPLDWEIFGTNAEIVTESNGTGQNEPWELIASGTLALPSERFAEGGEVFFTNNTVYTSYKFMVRSVKGPTGGAIDSMQISEFQLYTSNASGALAITSISPDLENDQVTITWNGPGGQTYSLESSTDLENWSGLVANNLTVESNSTYSFPAPLGNPARIFYRIVPN